MSFRARLGFITLLCLIASTQISCARSARAARISSAAASRADHGVRRGDATSKKIREAIRELKEHAATKPADVGESAGHAVPDTVGTSGTGATASTGTSGGALSVESRYPAPQGPSGAGGSGSIDAARDAERHVRQMWTAIIAACVLAAALVVSRLRRRTSVVGR